MEWIYKKYNIPDPSKTPPAIIISSLSHSEPFQPKLSTVINEYERDIIDGINWLKVIPRGQRFFK